MSISKTNITTFVNKALDGSYTGTELDIAINRVLSDLSKMAVLIDDDDTQVLTSSSTNLDYPTDCLDTDQAIISVELIDSNSVSQGRMRRLRGGWREYLRQMKQFNSSTRSDPGWMVTHDRKIYLYPPPGASYTTNINYYKRHGDIATDTLFDDSWDNAVYFGTVYFEALLNGSKEEMSIWQPQYYAEKEDRRRSIPREIAIEGAY